jgi:hypothetical protein
MKIPLPKIIDSIVRRMAYWIAYSCEANAVRFTEAEAVAEIAKILRDKFPFQTQIKREVDYRSINSVIKQNQRADLGIFIDGKCKCLIEVKLNENTNGGFKKDIKKLSQIKHYNPDIYCFVILLYRSSCYINEPKFFVSEDGKALKRTIEIDQGKIRVRRVSNALCSPTAKKMKKVVCFEIL